MTTPAADPWPAATAASDVPPPGTRTHPATTTSAPAPPTAPRPWLGTATPSMTTTAGWRRTGRTCPRSSRPRSPAPPAPRSPAAGPSPACSMSRCPGRYSPGSPPGRVTWAGSGPSPPRKPATSPPPPPATPAPDGGSSSPPPSGHALTITRIPPRPRGHAAGQRCRDRARTRRHRPGPGTGTGPDAGTRPGTSIGLVGRVTLTIPEDMLAHPPPWPRSGAGSGAGPDPPGEILTRALQAAATAAARARAAIAADAAAGGCAHTAATAGYRPPPRLKEYIAARDLTCRFPRCRQPAWRGDLDHTIPDDNGGLTCHCNLGGLCRTHHILKHHPDWNLRQTPPAPSPGPPPPARHVHDNARRPRRVDSQGRRPYAQGWDYGAVWVGSQMRTLSRPGHDSSTAWPPCARAIACKMDRPSPLPLPSLLPLSLSPLPLLPVPRSSVVSSLLPPAGGVARWKRSKALSVSGPDMPGPVATSISTPPLTSPSRTATGAFGGVCARTLPSRFASTWRIRGSSTTATSRGGASARTGRPVPPRWRQRRRRAPRPPGPSRSGRARMFDRVWPVRAVQRRGCSSAGPPARSCASRWVADRGPSAPCR